MDYQGINLGALYYYATLLNKPKRFSLDNYPDGKQFAKLFRFRSKGDVMQLYELLEIPDNVIIEKAAHFSGIEILCVTLRRLATKAPLAALRKEFRRSESDICRAFRYGVSHICAKFGHLIEDAKLFWFDMPYFSEYAESAKYKFLAPSPCRYFAAVDGNFRRTCRPRKNQSLFYSGYKKAHGIKFQGVMAFNGLFARMTGPYYGYMHDAAIFADSNLLDHIRISLRNVNDAEYYIVIGDTAYPTDENMQALLKKKAMPAAQPRFREWNKRVGNARRCVEHGFGQIVSNWRFVDDIHAQRAGIKFPGPSCCYRAASLLTNCLTCLYGNVVYRQFGRYLDDEGHEKTIFLPTMRQYLRNKLND